MNSARELLEDKQNYRLLRLKAKRVAFGDADDLLHDTCEHLLRYGEEFRDAEHFRASAHTLVYQCRHDVWRHQSRAKRTPETDCLFDPPVVEPVVDETFRLASWADDPTLKLALRREQGYTLTEMAEEEGVTRQAIEERIRRKIASLSRSFSVRHSTEESV